MEFLQVFDVNGNPINEKVSRAEKLNLSEGKYFMIVLIFIENDKGEFLLQKTSKSRNSCIATTGGHVSYGDSSFDTVIKECKEELGTDIVPDEIKYVGTIASKCGLIDIYYTKMNIDIESITIQPEEVESVNWYTKEQIFDLIDKKELREGNIKPFEKVLDYRKNISN